MLRGFGADPVPKVIVLLGQFGDRCQDRPHRLQRRAGKQWVVHALELQGLAVAVAYQRKIGIRDVFKKISEPYVGEQERR